MELPVDLTQPASAVDSPEISHVWVLQPVVTDARSNVASDARGYSYLAECECPDDCPRDHGNE